MGGEAVYIVVYGGPVHLVLKGHENGHEE